MESERPLFQILVNQKGWQEYEVFKRRYQEAARELADLEGRPLSRLPRRQRSASSSGGSTAR